MSAAVCRLCLNTNEVLPIFDEDGNQNDDVSQKIFDCVAIQVSKDNVLPTVICADCLGSVNTWYLFKQKCHQTQAQLLSMFKKELGEDLSHENVRVNGNASPAGKRPTEVVYLSDTDDECDADNDVTCLSPAAVSIISLNDDEASFQGVEDAEKVNKIPQIILHAGVTIIVIIDPLRD